MIIIIMNKVLEKKLSRSPAMDLLASCRMARRSRKRRDRLALGTKLFAKLCSYASQMYFRDFVPACFEYSLMLHVVVVDVVVFIYPRSST